VSSDPTAAVLGTELPVGCLQVEHPSDVLDAVSAVGRWPVDDLGRVPEARQLVVALLGEYCPLDRRATADLLGVHRRTLHRDGPCPRELLAVARRVLGDARFEGLHTEWLPGRSSWMAYARRRALPLRR
jgi:hypothetical protein